MTKTPSLEVLVDLGPGRPYALAPAGGDAVLVTLLEPGEVALVRTGDGPGAPAPTSRVAVGEQPGQLAVDPGGGCWCTLTGADALVRVDRDPDGNLVVGRRVAVPGGPYGLAADAGGLWFSLLSSHALGRMTWSGDVSTTALAPGSFPAMVALDGQGRTWVALNQAGSLACLEDGRVSEVRLPEGSAPVGLAHADGVLWVADIAGGRMFRVATEAGGATATVDTWALDPGSRPHAVVADPSGGCWFTQWGLNRLGRIDAAGTLVEQDLSAAGEEPHGLLLSSGSVLVAMESGNVLRVRA